MAFPALAQDNLLSPMAFCVAIGFKGGVEIARQGLGLHVGLVLAPGAALSVAAAMARRHA